MRIPHVLTFHICFYFFFLLGGPGGKKNWKTRKLETLLIPSYKIISGLDAIGVDPDQQRKGIGRLLMQYGAERAERDGKNIRFMASENGAKLYRALGYEEVGSCEILGGMEYSFVKRAKM